MFGGTVELIYNGSDERLLDLRPNHALYWNVIRWAAAHGQRRVRLRRGLPDHSARAASSRSGPIRVPNYRYTWRAGDAPSRAESMAAASYEVEQGGDTGLVGAGVGARPGAAHAPRRGARLPLPVANPYGVHETFTQSWVPLPLAWLPPPSTVPAAALMP